MKDVQSMAYPRSPYFAGRFALAAVTALALAGCGSVQLVATTNIPTPLITKVPVAIALHVPREFAAYVHKEERWSTDWNIELGKAQTDGIKRLVDAMFDRVVMVDSVNAGAQLGGDVRAILEPAVEEYAFVTPRDAGTPFYAVSIKYRVNVYSPDGRLADSWGFTGYGTSPSQGMSSSTPLAQATALALRDAGAKLAAEFREQAIVRGLLPDVESAPGTDPSIEPAPVPSPVPVMEETMEQSPPVQAAPAEASPAQKEEVTSEPEPAASGARSLANTAALIRFEGRASI